MKSAKPTPKKPYTKPTLTKHKMLRDITATVAPSNVK
jgi:hypothetical protein